MVHNVRRGFNPHGDKKVFFYKSGNNVLDFEYYMPFEYQYSKSSNVFVEHVQLLRGMFGFFKPREMPRSFVARGVYCLKLL